MMFAIIIVIIFRFSFRSRFHFHNFFILSLSSAFVPFIDVKRAVKLNNTNKMVLQQTKKSRMR